MSGAAGPASSARRPASAQPTAPPVRGTQSFVAVMSEVWHRPSLTALEVLWRWAAGAPLLLLLLWEAVRIRHQVPVDWAGLEALTVFQPVMALRTLYGTAAALLRPARPFLLWFLPLSFAIWVIAGTWGRARVLRRLSPTLRASFGPLLFRGALRSGTLLAAWALWVWGVHWAGEVAILRPALAGAEPSLVGYCALLIAGSLLLFVLWSASSWVLHLLPLEPALRAGTSAARTGGADARSLRGKLIETNLVMGIVKIALLVLAMVFSACPLPFSAVETPVFLACWWSAVGLLYLVALDFFHVAHTAAYVRLWRLYHDQRDL